MMGGLRMMDDVLWMMYLRMMDGFFVPFVNEKLPNYHILHMDNSPTHTAQEITQYLIENRINHRKTPAQSPDLNPIELVWHDLKFFLENEWKPTTRQELIDGIEYFWRTVLTVKYCNSNLKSIIWIESFLQLSDYTERLQDYYILIYSSQILDKGYLMGNGIIEE